MYHKQRRSVLSYNRPSHVVHCFGAQVCEWIPMYDCLGKGNRQEQVLGFAQPHTKMKRKQKRPRGESIGFEGHVGLLHLSRFAQNMQYMHCLFCATAEHREFSMSPQTHFSCAFVIELCALRSCMPVFCIPRVRLSEAVSLCHVPEGLTKPQLYFSQTNKNNRSNSRCAFFLIPSGFWRCFESG